LRRVRIARPNPSAERKSKQQAMREARDLKRALKEIERVWGPGGSVYQMTARQRKARGLASYETSKTPKAPLRPHVRGPPVRSGGNSLCRRDGLSQGPSPGVSEPKLSEVARMYDLPASIYHYKHKVPVWDSVREAMVPPEETPTLKNLHTFLTKRPHCRVWCKGREEGGAGGKGRDADRGARRRRSRAGGRRKGRGGANNSLQAGVAA
jgi:hypothetical protein